MITQYHKKGIKYITFSILGLSQPCSGPAAWLKNAVTFPEEYTYRGADEA
jgi:hypothetical protein